MQDGGRSPTLLGRRLGSVVGHLAVTKPGSPLQYAWRLQKPPATVPAAVSDSPVVRVAIFGAGGHARRAHAPNLRAIPGVEIVAIADANQELAAKLAADFAPEARLYTDGHDMLAAEPQIDALFSVVPAFVRPIGVEVAAAARGIHIFSEKPQTLDMPTAVAIADAIDASGVVSSVGFRERYRPLFRAARDFLADKEVVHVNFKSYGGLPGPSLKEGEEPTTWWQDFDKAGGGMFDWGCHAVDYVRFMTGLDIKNAQAYYNHPPEYAAPVSASINFQFENGGTMQSTFVQSGPSPDRQPWFQIWYVGGYLALFDYNTMEVDGEEVYNAKNDYDPAAPADGYVKAVGFDPWYEQDRCFLEDVRDAKIDKKGAEQRLVNDYRDGLKSLGPVLAAWSSARQGGEKMDVASFIAVPAAVLGVPAISTTSSSP